MKKWLFLVFLCSCTPFDFSGHEYRIPAGKHRGYYPNLPSSNSIDFTFTVDSSWYQVADPTGINKVAGIAFGLVHNNSVRLGWQCVDGQIIAYAYVYLEKVRITEPIAILNVGIWDCHISKTNRYIIDLGEVHKEYPCSVWLPGTILLPYIGGDGTFQKDWETFINFY